MGTTRYARTFAGVLGAAALTLALSHATVIDFENAWLTSTIPIDYADQVDSSGNDSQNRGGYNLTFGATPNVQVQMFSADYQGNTWNQLDNLYRWSSWDSSLHSE